MCCCLKFVENDAIMMESFLCRQKLGMLLDALKAEQNDLNDDEYVRSFDDIISRSLSERRLSK